MKVFRLCDSNEIENLIAYKTPKALGQTCKVNPIRNNHQYAEGKKYMHFFKDEISILYLAPAKGNNICVYDIPEDILKRSEGYGNYADFINLEHIQQVTEYAIPSDDMKLDYLKIIYLITEDMDFDYYPEREEIYNCLTCMVDLDKKRNEERDNKERDNGER